MEGAGELQRGSWLRVWAVPLPARVWSWWQLASCVIMGKLLNPSEPSFLEREKNDSTCLAVLGRCNDTALVALLERAQSGVGTQ